MGGYWGHPISQPRAPKYLNPALLSVVGYEIGLHVHVSDRMNPLLCLKMYVFVTIETYRNMR